MTDNRTSLHVECDELWEKLLGEVAAAEKAPLFSKAAAVSRASDTALLLLARLNDRTGALERVAHEPVTPIVSADEFDELERRVAALEGAKDG